MTNQAFALKPGRRDLDRNEWRWVHRLLRVHFRRALRVLGRVAGDARTLDEVVRRVMLLHVTTPADLMHSVVPMVATLPRVGGVFSRALVVDESLWSTSSAEERRGIVAWALAVVGLEGSTHCPVAAVEFRWLRDVFGAPGAWYVVEQYIAARLASAWKVVDLAQAKRGTR